MTIEEVKRANVLMSCIECANENIRIFENFSSLKEIQISDTNKEQRFPHIYITGDAVKKMMDIEIKEWKEYRRKHEEELSKL